MNARADGEFKVRVLDPSGLPYPGFFRRDCAPVQGDSVAHEVHWQNNLGSLQGKLGRLEFSLRDTQLFGFEFTKS